ncbi:MAG: AAA family ATPase [Sphingobium sp.]
MTITIDDRRYEARQSRLLDTVRDVLRRRYATLLLVAGLIAGLGAALVFSMTPRYEGLTRIQIDPSRNPLARTVNEKQAQLASEAIETEVAIVTSLEVARQVVRRLGLITDPEFASTIERDQKERALTPPEKLDIVARDVLAHLDVAREQLTYIINIRFHSRDAAKAARIANAFSAVYIDTRIGSRTGAADGQFKWFQKRLDELALQARIANENLADFQSKAGIARIGDQQQVGVADQKIGALAGQLAHAQALAANGQAQLAAAQAQVRAGRGDSVGTVLGSSTISDFRRQRAEVVHAKGEIEGRYGPLHPETVKIGDQLAQIDRQIDEETQRLVGSLRANASASAAQVARIDATMRGLEAQQSSQIRAGVIAASLQREADAKQAAYEQMAQSAAETRQASQNSLAQVLIIDAAEPAQRPYWPDKPLFLLLSLMVGVGAGIGTITAQELMTSGMRSAGEIKGELGIPLLGAVPFANKTSRPADLLIYNPTSPFAESLRNARASIMGIRSATKPRIIALTSALPGEGKTTTALALARTMALAGTRTLIMDMDVRRGQLREIVRTEARGVGTVELLRGKATIDEAVEASAIANLDQLVVRRPYYSSENLFGTETVHLLIDGLAERYDVIILDLPPLLGLADGRFLAALADAVVLVVKWSATPAHLAAMALSSLKADDSNVIGAIFSMVDQKWGAIGTPYHYPQGAAAYARPD